MAERQSDPKTEEDLRLKESSFNELDCLRLPAAKGCEEVVRPFLFTKLGELFTEVPEAVKVARANADTADKINRAAWQLLSERESAKSPLFLKDIFLFLKENLDSGESPLANAILRNISGNGDKNVLANSILEQGYLFLPGGLQSGSQILEPLVKLDVNTEPPSEVRELFNDAPKQIPVAHIGDLEFRGSGVYSPIGDILALNDSRIEVQAERGAEELLFPGAPKLTQELIEAHITAHEIGHAQFEREFGEAFKTADFSEGIKSPVGANNPTKGELSEFLALVVQEMANPFTVDSILQRALFSLQRNEGDIVVSKGETNFEGKENRRYADNFLLETLRTVLTAKSSEVAASFEKALLDLVPELEEHDKVVHRLNAIRERSRTKTNFSVGEAEDIRETVDNINLAHQRYRTSASEKLRPILAVLTKSDIEAIQQRFVGEGRRVIGELRSRAANGFIDK